MKISSASEESGAPRHLKEGARKKKKQHRNDAWQHHSSAA